MKQAIVSKPVTSKPVSKNEIAPEIAQSKTIEPVKDELAIAIDAY